MLDKSYVPVLPFPEFKWKWASVQCTESINDPVVLLGVLFRMRKLEPMGYKYSSPEFAAELISLSNDIADSVGVNLTRTGERNLIRNSGQYWRALKLIVPGDTSGKIRLTEFGKKVADRQISQTEFAAISVKTFELPNPTIQSSIECYQWQHSGIHIHPLRLILGVLYELFKRGQGYITPEELQRIVVPLSPTSATLEDYANFIIWYRNGDIGLIEWPDCCPRANDKRIVREYLLFLNNYGYLVYKESETRHTEKYYINTVILEEILSLINTNLSEEDVLRTLEIIRTQGVASELERKRTRESHRNSNSRPHQAQFRKDVLDACQRCIITNVSMPEVLEAAHIKPYKYNGEDTIANGFAMRTDIHLLFDTGHLRISPDGVIDLSTRARYDYGASIPPRIVIPNFTNRDFLQWRWDNYDGL